MNVKTITRNISIIEDNKQIREGLAEVLVATEKYIVTEYDNCEDAIRNLQRDKPDLILMDIDLPGMNGIEGTSKIKRQLPQCLVLIITVFEDSEKVFQSLCAGAGGYLVKNSNVGEVLRGVEEALAGGAPMSLNIASMVVKSFKLSLDSPLTERETQVLHAIAKGKTYTKIATELFINKETVRSHIRNIYQKLAVNSKAEALKVASNNRWIANQH